MPLPAALLARLQKRGIVKAETEPEAEEEVIAEDYDDQDKKTDINDNDIDNEKEEKEVEKDEDMTLEEVKEPIIGCPNKWNIYHECTGYCKTNWGDGKPHSSPNTERKRLKMLKKYPLLEGWDEVYDPGTGRHYYWNTRTDEVSWLPPGHPRSKISLPAEKLRALVRETFLEEIEDGEEQMESESEEDEEEDDRIDQKDEDTNMADHLHRREHGRERSRGRMKVKENDLDPMDPAAYSEAPRGTWSSGLDRKGEAKTGADTTASGPLYQMRPYPSPGAVLRMNAEMKPKDSAQSDEEA